MIATGTAAAQIVEIQWDKDNRFHYEGEVPAGKALEICDKLTKNQVLKWQFTGAAALNFNIHYHDDKAVVFPAKQDNVAKLGDTLIVPVDQDYCWMWKNLTPAPVTLQLQIQLLE
ncbi:hypothetical protein HPT27_13030 [Permianibacter sp. IMCC34836]|uniref:hypothetical protein n=1 Tax=Permianibacter fluminis TaxID=2738515 RepID=UPI0015527C9E|nr:hypothetical protein [Permianibacter fluminis]NQD37948.1 hypothetical protein [Permianibacter fluminis]